MAEIDIAKLQYKVTMLMTTGELLDITGLCMSLSWGDDKGSIAQKANVSLANTKIEKGYISDLIKLCTPIFIYADNKEVFRGIVWEWSYTSAVQKEISITAYDRMIYATQSKTNSYYSSGKNTKFIVEDICKEWSMPVNYSWENWTHGKIKIDNKAISEHITTVLDEAQTKLDSKYVLFMNKDTLEIKKKGSNKDVFVFHTGNVINTRNTLSLQNLVTKVMIVGKSEEEQRTPIIESVEGNTEYGLLQEIVTKDTNKTLDDAKKEADNILKEKGKPNETIEVSTIDVPILRKGDKIKITAGNLKGYFFIEGITHNADNKTMDMELSRNE